VAERVDRIAALAREIAPLVGADADQAEFAARLSKADLASAMVGEFPELQGVMGGYYVQALFAKEPFPLDGGRVGMGVKAAGADGAVETTSADTVTPNPGPSPIKGEGGDVAAIADAVRDHYKPQGPADTVPTAPLTVAVALADKLDTLVGFFAIDEKPTGSKDPFALRRAALGVIRLVLENGARIPLAGVISDALASSWVKAWGRPIAEKIDLELDEEDGVLTRPGTQRLAELRARDLQNEEPEGRDVESDVRASADLLAFFADRLKVLLRDQGKRHDLVDAVFALGDNDLVRIVRRVEALDAFLATDDGANLLAGYKRASNILRAEEKKGPVPTGMVETGLANQPAEETTLAFAAAAAATAVDAALETEDFAGAMKALAALRAPVDAFFDKVLVNSDAAEERANRLKLLGQVRAVMGRVADFGMVGG